MNYDDYFNKIIKAFEKEKYIVLATSNSKGIISCSTMSMINIGTKLYLQTDKYSEKAQNISENENVGFALNNMYFKGKAKIMGHPLENKEYVDLVHLKHPYTEKSYLYLKDDVLIVVSLYECKIWGYEKIKGVQEETLNILNFENKSIKRELLPNLSNGYDDMKVTD